MNENNVINLINEIAYKYQLTQVATQELITKYHNDARDVNVIRKEIENLSAFYQYQNKLNNIINNTPQLQPGKNYYVTAFDNNSNLFLQPVSVTITNPETSEVLVENIETAVKQTGINKVVLAGGVSANTHIRSEFEKLEQKGIKIYKPDLKLCGDNAAMIGAAGYYRYLNGDLSKNTLNAVPNLKIGE